MNKGSVPGAIHLKITHDFHPEEVHLSSCEVCIGILLGVQECK